MARPVSEKVRNTLEELRHRIRNGVYRPGEKFLSNRALADRFHISYQTADRVLKQLQQEALLERRAGSGTFIRGERTTFTGVALVMSPRSRRKDSFGARLRELLVDRLRGAGIPVSVRTTFRTAGDIPADRLPIAWEVPALANAFAARRRRAVLVNEAPPPGLAAAWIDSVSSDDFSGGFCAAELLGAEHPGGRFVVLAGPRDDPRCRDRVAGFRALFPHARVAYADSWFTESGKTIASRLLTTQPDGLFCCNDRLAQAAIEAAQELGAVPPRIIGFDNAPIAETLNFTSVGFPWEDVADAVLDVVRRRLSGDPRPGRRLVLPPCPIARSGPPR
jgi:DNA-binding transcriptional regulator YhcF (GntR family)